MPERDQRKRNRRLQINMEILMGNCKIARKNADILEGIY